jgi:ribose transport system substrate-binding protein
MNRIGRNIVISILSLGMALGLGACGGSTSVASSASENGTAESSTVSATTTASTSGEEAQLSDTSSSKLDNVISESVTTGSSTDANTGTGLAKEDQLPEGTDLSDISIAFVVSDLSNPFFAKLVDKMKAYADEKGFQFTAQECIEDSDKIDAIENFTSSGTDVIIVHVSNADALKNAALNAEKQGVRVISYDTDIEGTSAFVGIDNHEYGYAIGKNAAEWINETFDPSEEVKVGVCTYPDFPFLVVREQGIEDALNDISPNAKVVVSAKAGETPGGVDVGDAWVQSNPDLNVVVGINDSGVLGVYQAFKAAGLTNNDKIGFFGGDAVDEALSAIKEGGAFKATVSTNMLLHYEYFLDAACTLAINGKLENREILFPLTKVDISNVDEYIENNQ